MSNGAANGSSKPAISLLVCGHVDAGKSTLVGNMLFSMGLVDKKQMHKYKQDSQKLGKGSFAYAWVMDESSEERSRGVTIDVAQRQVETDNFIVTILDAPGHRDFVPNMITGATQADAALLVVDCSRGEFEAGFTDQGQTKEHVILLKSLGVSQLIVVANKMDNVDWSESRVKEVEALLRPFLKTLDVKGDNLKFVPCSGLEGDNLLSPVGSKAPWYTGPTVIQAIDQLKPPNRQIETDILRFFVTDAFKPQGSGFCCQGRVEVGRLKIGAKVLVMPKNVNAQIKDIEINDETAQETVAGQLATLTLTGLNDLSDLPLGAVICSPDYPISAGRNLLVRLVVLGERPLLKGLPVTFHNKSLQEQARLSKLETQIDRSNGKLIRKNPRVLVKKMAGTVRLELVDRPICVETFSVNKELSRFTIRSSGETLATGVVLEVLP